MDYKKLILYFGLTTPVIGVRECLHDWEEGDVINTDGVKTEIYAKFDGTAKNLMEVYKLFNELNTPTSMKGLTRWLDYYDVLDNPELATLSDFPSMIDTLSYMRCNQWTVKKRQYADYEKRLDLMEECVANIA